MPPLRKVALLAQENVKATDGMSMFTCDEDRDQVKRSLGHDVSMMVPEDVVMTWLRSSSWASLNEPISGRAELFELPMWQSPFHTLLSPQNSHFTTSNDDFAQESPRDYP